MKDLPRGWQECVLDEIVSDVSYGYTAKANKHGDARMLRITDIQDYKVDWSTVPYCTISGAEKKKYALRKMDLVFARTGATVGKSFLIRDHVQDAVFASYLIRVRCVADDMAEYLKYFFDSPAYWNQITELSAGVAQPNVNGSKLRALKVPLPPHAEQQRIVDKLDAVLARVDACRERLDRVPIIIKSFKQSVLAAATSGRLTAQWRQEHNITADSWTSATIEGVCVTVFDGPFGSNLKSDDYTSHGVRVVRLENIGHLEFIGSKETYISEEKYSGLTKHTITPGDILFSSFVDEEVRVCQLPGNLPTTAINKADCFCLRTNADLCDPRFLTIRLACRSTFVELKEQVHGATRPRINLKQLRQFAVRMPSLGEQREIVRRVDALFAYCDELYARLSAAQEIAKNLTPALLAKAFRGELVPQDPNDEPAAELLQRLAKERSGEGKATKARRAKRAASVTLSEEEPTPVE
nr:restriction endonuclease subunit S [Burkholderia ambifaria]